MSEPLNLELFVSYRCPFCRKVLAYMRQAGIEIPLRDVDLDPTSRPELTERGGKMQVPCLFINGDAMYESEEIVTWLCDNVA